MRPSAELQQLVADIAPYWAAEAEVIRAYFDSAQRTRETDLLWLARQCRKEFWDSFDGGEDGFYLGAMKFLLGKADVIDRGFDRHEALEIIEGGYQEFAHYCAFADAYDAIRSPDEPQMDPYRIRSLETWPENQALSDLRAHHTDAHGEVGMRACRITEGGYCALFSEGIRIAGRGGADDAIAAACARVYDDEFEHMLKGIAGLDQEGIAPAEWHTLDELAIEQMRARLPMRNAQFKNPVAPARLAELSAGKATPVVFDWKRAGFDG